MKIITSLQYLVIKPTHISKDRSIVTLCSATLSFSYDVRKEDYSQEEILKLQGLCKKCKKILTKQIK